MPGRLPDNACCPKCSTPIEAIMRLTNSDGVTAEYFHSLERGRARRRRRCVVIFDAPLSDQEQGLVMYGKVA
jgi:hypothetical protein